MKKYSHTKSGRIRFIEQHDADSSTNGLIKVADEKDLIDSGVEISPYVEPVKTLGQLQDEAIAAMSATVIAECRSGTGKLYFSDLNSAARHSSAEIQPDAEIRERAIKLLKWDIAIDAYALEVVFSIEQGGVVLTLESFIAGLPKL